MPATVRRPRAVSAVPSSENAACRSAPSGAVRVTILGWWHSKAGATPNEVRASPAPGGGGNDFDGQFPPSATGWRSAQENQTTDFTDFTDEVDLYP